MQWNSSAALFRGQALLQKSRQFFRQKVNLGLRADQRRQEPKRVRARKFSRRPASKPRSTTWEATIPSASSAATIRPRPRTSTMPSICESLSRRYAPTSVTRWAMPSSSMAASVALAAAMARQEPPNVEPWSPGSRRARYPTRALRTGPSGSRKRCLLRWTRCPASRRNGWKANG